MPIFEYKCEACGHITEKLVLTNDPVTCDKCGSQNMNKLMSAASSFTGSHQNRVPGRGDTGCCGSSPHATGCIPGSCCGKA